MAKSLVLQFDEKDYSFQLTKIDRSKLYGSREVEVLDESDRACDLATLADDGRTLVGRGGAGLGYLSPDGMWLEKSELIPVDVEGCEVQSVASSFAAPTPLGKPVEIDEYLSHNIRSLYLLETDEDQTEGFAGQVAAPLADQLSEGAVFKFPFSYRGGLEADAGFVLMGADDHIFLALGKPARCEFVGLRQAAPAFEEENSQDDDEDMMDFEMM